MQLMCHGRRKDRLVLVRVQEVRESVREVRVFRGFFHHDVSEASGHDL